MEGGVAGIKHCDRTSRKSLEPKDGNVAGFGRRGLPLGCEWVSDRCVSRQLLTLTLYYSLSWKCSQEVKHWAAAAALLVLSLSTSQHIYDIMKWTLALVLCCVRRASFASTTARDHLAFIVQAVKC